jgi:hypothetical protein
MSGGSSLVDPDPGSGIRCLFDPWIRNLRFGILNRLFLDPIPYLIKLRENFWVKGSQISVPVQNKILFNAVKFMGNKKRSQMDKN